MKNFASLPLLTALILLSVRGVPARGWNQDSNDQRQARAGSTVTATLAITSTSSAVKTTTITTKYVCVSLATADGATPSAACRKRRNANWYRGNSAPLLYVVYGDDGRFYDHQFDIQPSPVFKLQATALPEYRVNSPVMVGSKPIAGPSGIQQQHHELESSFEKTPDNIRVAQPIYFNGLSSLISSVVNNILTSTTTVTSTVTAYTSTSTAYSYTASTTVTLGGVCYPSGITTCTA